MHRPTNSLASLAATAALAAQAPQAAPTPWFAELTAVPATLHETHGIAAGDLDGDGDLDLVLAAVGDSVLWRNDGNGTFVEVTGKDEFAIFGEANAVAVHDLDGDRRPDVFLACGGWRSAINELLHNDGGGRFRRATYGSMPQDYFWTNGVRVGDIDGDGDPDLFLARYNFSGWFENDGKGRFKNRPDAVPALHRTTMAALLFDVDDDGDLDAVLGNAGYECNQVWINDGKGHFTDESATRLPADQDDTMAMAAGDVDGDGVPDFVTGNGRLGGEQPRLYHNDGKGRFVDATDHLPQVRCQTMAVLLFDADGDGDLDLVLGNADAGGGASNLLWLNDGKGRFTPAPADAFPDVAERTTCLLAVDLDGDGRQELVVGNGALAGSRTRIYRPLHAMTAR
ncbi:MAG: VCBS repeat-containing protein [Planctomycetota bacterium]